MKFKLTILLLLANAAVFFSIWILERKPSAGGDSASSFLDFTVLEISGRGLDKPRVLKLENNRWRIVSPIDWSANYYAVNRIKNQLEFLDKEANFPVSEIEKVGQSLADFGLDNPVYTFKYGDGRNMRELKIGRSAPVGSRVYMLDTHANRIIVVNKSLVEDFASDIDDLRGMNVFDIPRFEVSAFSIRLAPGGGAATSRANLRRIGLVRDEGNSWSFETPIVAGADSREVNAFLDRLLSLSARSFAPENAANTGLDVSSFPTSITIQGTNRKQTLLLGNVLSGGVLRYARLEENPTVFLVDAAMFKDLGALQTGLRDKAFLKFDELDLDELDISSPSSSVKLKKLGSGQWDAVGKDSSGEVKTVQADYAIVNTIISRLKSLRARDFVTDAPGDNAGRYGFDSPRLKITLRQSSGKSQTLVVGGLYKDGGAELAYAGIEGDPPVYGILPDFVGRIPADLLGAKSRMFSALPEKAAVVGLSLYAEGVEAPIFEASNAQGLSDADFRLLPETRRIAAFRLLKSVEKFAVSKYLDMPFSDKGISVDGKLVPWAYRLAAEVKMPGTGGDKSETRTWLFTKRLSGTVQYGAGPEAGLCFEIPRQLMDSIGELGIEASPPPVFKSEPPKPLTEIPSGKASGVEGGAADK